MTQNLKNQDSQKSPRKTLVIPDLHNYIIWVEPALEKLKAKYHYDEVVFLGDYFDHYGDGAWEAQRTAIWLKASLQKEDRIHLVGNHDMPYLIPNNDSLYCPGFTPTKCRVINNELAAEDRVRFRPAYYSNDFLFSHAGFHPVFAINQETNLVYPPEELILRAQKEMELLKGGVAQPLFLPGDRMAEPRIGGITWADWNSEFTSVPGLKQMVGHTPGRTVRTKDDNFCIDTHNRFVVLITNGSVEAIPI